MSLSAPRHLFGVHQFSPYSLETGEFFGTIKCLTGSSLSLSGEQVKLNAGSNRYAWSVETGLITAEMSLKFSEYPAFIFELFLGKAPTTSTSVGEVAGFANKKGASIKSGSAGVSSVDVIPTTGAANLKFGKYVLKAVDANTLAVYHSTDINHDVGTDVEYMNDALKVAELDIGSGANDLAAFGLRLMGVGTAAFVAGDTAEFHVYPAGEKMEVVIGGAADVTPEFGCIVMAEKRSDKSLVALEVFRAKASGLPLGLESKAFSESEVKIDCLFDPAKNGVFKFLSLKPQA